MSSSILPSKLVLNEIKKSYPSDRLDPRPGNPPEKCLELIDPSNNKIWGFIVVDNTQRGPGLGGIRIAPDLSLNEIKRLARAMTLKNSAANLPFGGGKSGIKFDPIFLNENPGIKRDLLGMFAEPLFMVDDYISAPDMGTNENDIQQIYELFSNKLGTPEHLRGGSSRPPEKGGIPIDDWGLTAHSLFISMKTLEEIHPDFVLANSRIIIQGYGNVGSHIATKLNNYGARIIGASDIHIALWNSEGLDVNELNQIRVKPNGLANYSQKIEKRFPSEKLDWLLEGPCDILVPAARPDAITSRNADRIQCKFIFQGANSPSNKMTEYYLQNRRGIISFSDFIVNVGGVMGCAVELKMTFDKDYRSTVLSSGNNGKNYLENLIQKTVSSNIRFLWNRLNKSLSNDTIFREEATILAEERLTNCQETWL